MTRVGSFHLADTAKGRKAIARSCNLNKNFMYLILYLFYVSFPFLRIRGGEAAGTAAAFSRLFANNNLQI